MLKFYTDGASTMKKINNEWIRCNGGAAMVCINDENKIIAEYKRGFKSTTNNYCELHAIYLALSYWNNNYPNEEIEIYSDSAYCVNMLKENGWIYSWEKNGWTRGKKHEPIENLPIIKKIWELLDDDVTFIKVKGHSGNLYNELVDKMAVEAREKGEWFNEIH
jgi:ribonuclease HI